MAKLGDLVVNIGANTKDLNKALGRVRRDMRSMTSNFDAVGRSLTKSLTLPLAAVGTFALKSAADLEKLEVSFISLTGGAEQAGNMMKQLNEFTAKTPFQIDAVAKSARQLIASGTEISEVNNQLQFLGDIAATSGSSIDEIAAIFAKVNAKGKVELENLNQLAERGIPIFTALSESTGLLPNKLGAGRVSVEQFNETLKSFAQEGGFAHGAMERLSETATGKFSTALDNVKIAGAAMMDDLLPAFKGLLDSVINVAKKIGSFDQSTKKIIVTVGAFVAALGPILITLPRLVAGVQTLRTGFIALNAAMLANPLAAIAVSAGVLTAALVSLIDTTSQAEKNTNEFIESLEGLDKKQKQVGITTRIELLKTEKVQMEVAARAEKMANSIGMVGDRLDKQVSRGSAQRYTEQVKNLGEEIKLLETEFKNLSLEKLDADFEEVEESIVKVNTALEETEEAVDVLHSFFMPAHMIVQSFQEVTDGVHNFVLESTPQLLGFLNDFETVGEKASEIADEMAVDMGDSVDTINSDLDSFADSVQSSMGQAASAMLSNIGAMVGGAQMGIDGILLPLANMAVSLGELAIGYGIAVKGIKTALESLSGPAAIVAGIALVALGTGLKGAIAERADDNLPALAEGGLAFGPTTALIGDNRNARIDPEVVAPLSKLRDMLGGGSVNVYGRISGDDIVISNNRATRDRNRFA